MDIKIMSLVEAITYRPDKPTYAIRIFGGKYLDDFSKFPLKDSSFYIHIAKYIFDDNLPGITSGPAWINDEIAVDIINSFSSKRGSIECLLVHCLRGRNRSPSVAIALNEIFNLGHDTNNLKRCYTFQNGEPEYNYHIYETIKRNGINRRF